VLETRCNCGWAQWYHQLESKVNIVVGGVVGGCADSTLSILKT
jgi:hypothetical protein